MGDHAPMRSHKNDPRRSRAWTPPGARAIHVWRFSRGRSARGAGKILDAGGAEARPREPSAHAHDRMTHGARASPPQHQGVKPSHQNIIYTSHITHYNMYK